MYNNPLRDDVRKILVFKFGGVGDYVNLMPLLQDLKEYYFNSHITVVLAPSGKELLEHAGCVDSLITSNMLYKQGVESVLSLDSLKDLLRIRRELDSPYDLFIDATSKYSIAGILKPFLVKVLSKAVLSVGLDYKKRGFFLDRRIPEERYEEKHNILRYNDILASLGASPSFHLATITPSAEAVHSADDFFKGFKNRLKIGIHPGANIKYFESRAWSVERFTDLIERIDSSCNCDIFITASKNERFLIEKIHDMCMVDIIPVPETSSIVDFCAYLSRFDYYVSNDTGPMHLAVAMGVPTVGIFGHADFESYGSYPDFVPFEAVRFNAGRKYGPSTLAADPRGLKSISIEDVLESFNKLRESR